MRHRVTIPDVRTHMNAAKLRKMVYPRSGLDGVQRNWNQLLLELR